MGKTSIEWTKADDGTAGATWNPVRGCSRLTTGCGGPNHQGGCYAEKIAARFSGPGQPFEGFAERTPHGGRWTGKMALVPEMLALPLRWRKPRRIFVNSMSDLFHRALPRRDVDRVFAVMALTPQHTHQFLTKRSEELRDYASDPETPQRVWKEANEIADDNERLYLGALAAAGGDWGGATPWPLRNVWAGVSVEDRACKVRIDHLRATPAAIRFVSFEPLLEDLGTLDLTGINLAIVGGESGPRSRDFMLSWPTSILAQCREAGVKFFLKQVGANAYDDRSYVGSSPRYETKSKKGGDMAEWPEDLRVREMPR